MSIFLYFLFLKDYYIIIFGDDDTKFHICKSDKGCDGVDEYYYYDIVNNGDDVYLRRSVLLSEMDLTNPIDSSQKQQIANQLLSYKRLRRKIKTNHGYVGYIQGRQMYFNREFEEEKLHVAEHI